MSRSALTHWRGWAWTAISLHFLLLLYLGLSRHWGYMTSLNDLGAFDQVVWETVHGEFLLNTSLLDQPINWLGFHFNPILLLFVPLYAITPYPEWLTLAQALALSLAAWPIFLLASRVCESERAGLLWAIAYLANPFLLNAAAWDFHPVALAVPLIALGLLAIEKADSRLLLFSCLPLLLIQEQLGLTLAALGLLWWLRNKRGKIAVLLIALGLAQTVLVLGILMPALSPTGANLMLGNGTGHISRYAWLGQSVGDIALNVLLHPWSVTHKVLFDWWGWVYLALLLAPFLAFPLAAAVYLLPALPDLAANLLSSNRMPTSVFAYHSVTLVPVLTIAAAYGAQRFSRRWTWLSSTQFSGLALLASLAIGYALAPLPAPGAVNYWTPAHFLNTPDPAPTAIRATLGSASVSAQNNIGANFSQRSRIYLYPRKLDEVDAIVLRLESPTKKLLPKDPEFTASLASHLQMRPAEYLASIECLLADKQYGIQLWDAPWLVLSRNSFNREASGEVMRKLDLLKHEWRVETGAYQAALQQCQKHGRGDGKP